FNFSSTVVSGSPFRIGHWKLLVNTEGYNYEWEYDGSAADTADSSEPPHVHRESVKRRAVETTGDYELLVDRQSGHFLFFGNKLPKLEKDKLSVTLLKEEETIKPLYDTFARVQRRNFHAEGLQDALAIQAVS